MASLSRHGLSRPAPGAVPQRRRRLRVPRLDPLPRARPQGGQRRRPRRAHRDRLADAQARHPAGHPRRRPRRSPDALRARGGARGRGLRRRALVVSDQRRHAGQPRALPGAGAARRAGRRAAQRARLGDRRPRALRRAADVGPARVRAGARHGARRHARARSKAALEATPGARAAFIVSPTYYGMAADVAGCAEVAHAAGVPLVVDQSWGPHFGFHRALPPSALHVGADAMLTSVHKIAGSPDPVRAAARVRLRPHRPRRRRPHAAADALDVAVLAADALARRRAPPARPARRGAALEHDRRLAPHGAGDRRDPRLPRRRRRGDRPPRRRRARPAADRHRRPRHRRDGLRDRRRAALELRHAGRARHAGDDRARAGDRRAAARARALRPRPDVDRRADGAPGPHRGGHARRPARSRTRS